MTRNIFRYGNLDGNQFEKSNRLLGEIHDRYFINSGDLFYASRKLLPLLSLSHEQRSSNLFEAHVRRNALTICVKYAISCEIHDTFSEQFLRDLGSRQLSTFRYLPSPLSRTCGYAKLTLEIQYFAFTNQLAITKLSINVKVNKYIINSRITRCHLVSTTRNFILSIFISSRFQRAIMI